MTRRASVEEMVAAGLASLAEQDKIPPAERFDRMVRAGMIDAQGRVLHPMYVNTPERCSFCADGPCKGDLFGNDPGQPLSLNDRMVTAGAQALADSGLLSELCPSDGFHVTPNEYLQIARAVLEGARHP